MHQTDKSPFDPKWIGAKYVEPPSYVGALGPHPKKQAADLPLIRLNETDVQNDLKWMPELISSFRDICSRASYRIGLFDVDDSAVIRHLSKSYVRFLFLCKTCPQLGHDLAPPVAIDLLWHAHEATPKLFEEETTQIVGFRIDHDPWPQGNDSAGSN